MTKGEARAVLGVLTAAFPAGDPLPDVAIDLYVRLLEPYSHEQAQRAVERLIVNQRSAFMPPMAVILDAMVDAPPLIVAWGEVARQVQKTGRYNQPEFANPLIHEAVRRMGWWALCDGDPDYQPGKNERDFATIYDAVCSAAREQGCLPPSRRPVTLPKGWNEAERLRDDETLDEWRSRQGIGTSRLEEIEPGDAPQIESENGRVHTDFV